jgi:hypothetical protein
VVANVASRKTRHSPGDLAPEAYAPAPIRSDAVVFASAGVLNRTAPAPALPTRQLFGVDGARGRQPLALGSAVVSGRARIDVKLSLDRVRVHSETNYAWAGPYVLSVHTVILQPDLAIELHSTFTVTELRALSRGFCSVAEPGAAPSPAA